MRRCVVHLVLCYALLGSGNLCFGQHQTGIPVPDARSCEEAKRLVLQVYGERIRQARTPEDCEVLVQNMLMAEGGVTEESRRYVLLECARDLAIRAGLAQAAFYAIDRRERYAVDIFKERVEALEGALRNARSPEQRKAIAVLAEDLREEILQQGDCELTFERAARPGNIAFAAARAAGDRDLAYSIQSRNQETQAMQEEYELIADSLRWLQRDPLASAANFQTGRYYCLVRRKWDLGLTYLALGPSEHELTKLAIRDLQRPSGEDQVKLADQWLALSKQWKEEGNEKAIVWKSAAARARHWYRQARGSISDPLLRNHIDSRLNEIAGLLPELRLADSSGQIGAHQRGDTVSQRKCLACHGSGRKRCKNCWGTGKVVVGHHSVLAGHDANGRPIFWVAPVMGPCPMCGSTGLDGPCVRCGGTGIEPPRR